MEAVILAGGQGTRLAPYTTELPKALVPVCGKPVVEVLLHRLKLAGVTKAYLAVGHRADQLRTALGDGRRLGLELSYSEEPMPLSTVGPITLLPSLPEYFFVANADILTDLDFAMLYDHHRRSDCELTVATYQRTEKIDYGVIEADHNGRVTKFSEKPDYHFSVSTGIYVFSKAVLEFVPHGQPFGFDDLMRTMLEKHQPVNTVQHHGFWLDIGRIDDYERANSGDAESVRRLCE
ncbi:MAG: NTP transferase domain-containing protein [candidate division Zixibacteria bacterium]|nr:NTP transferase domain-containing protein [candidate division Zixibacteria bacterium]